MLERWCDRHNAALVFDKAHCLGGDLLFLVSCSEIIGRDVRDRYAKTLVIHESNLPNGRGWSPLAWQILDGRDEFVISLIEAADRVDSGAIWNQETLTLEGHELSDEINEKRDAVRERLMDWGVENFYTARPREQVGEASYYARRTPADSRLDPHRSIAAQFDLLRICDPRFPAFFDLRGHRYVVDVRKSA